MNGAVTRVVIVGGGTAGWLAAASIAARGGARGGAPVEVTLIEAPDIPTIGVGEGTWPTMRATLERIGLAEADFLCACDASFKQGTRFVGWRDGIPGDGYDHPFTPPVEIDPGDLGAGLGGRPPGSFAEAVSAQPGVSAAALAPRQRGMPDYAGALNYGYHLDAGKFARLLERHATERLGVHHLRRRVVGVERGDNGDIAAVRTDLGEPIGGDLFLDCSGHAALLIGSELDVPAIDRTGELFNDRALVVQVPVAPDTPIASTTIATAHAAGWLWDIGLPTRRGIGCVYASDHLSDDEAAATLRAYLNAALPDQPLDALAPRRLAFRSAHRARFWERNCLALGLSAGFLEPLEASAIVLIELSLEMLLDNFPTTRAAMDAHARRFNELFRYRWDRIVEFLKLHYVLSARTEPYWRAHRDPVTIAPRLAELLTLWRDQPPSRYDLPTADEVFPAASYRYVLYGMGFPLPALHRNGARLQAEAMLHQVAQRGRALAASLPTNRAYLDALAAARHAPSAATGVRS